MEEMSWIGQLIYTCQLKQTNYETINSNPINHYCNYELRR